MGLRLAVITTTFYPSTKEGNLRKGLARKFFLDMVNKDYEVFVVDGGTDDGRFIDELKSFGVQAFPETQRGLGNSRREALTHALATRPNYILWTEPEKVDLVRSIPFMVETISLREADCLVPSRNTLSKYPLVQQCLETIGNQLHTDYGYWAVGEKPIDAFFGPRLWESTVSGAFQLFGDSEIPKLLAEMRMERAESNYKSEFSDAEKSREIQRAEADLSRTDHMIQMPVCLLVLQRYTVISCPVNYEHSIEQTRFEQTNKSVFNTKMVRQLSALDEQFGFVRWVSENGKIRQLVKRYLFDENIIQ